MIRILLTCLLAGLLVAGCNLPTGAHARVMPTRLVPALPSATLDMSLPIKKWERQRENGYRGGDPDTCRLLALTSRECAELKYQLSNRTRGACPVVTFNNTLNLDRMTFTLGERHTFWKNVDVELKNSPSWHAELCDLTAVTPGLYVYRFTDCNNFAVVHVPPPPPPPRRSREVVMEELPPPLPAEPVPPPPPQVVEAPVPVCLLVPGPETVTTFHGPSFGFWNGNRWTGGKVGFEFSVPPIQFTGQDWRPVCPSSQH